jgi:cardiolipin synthase
MTEWTGGNHLRLLENGEEFFPRVLEAVAAAREEILIETFIWSEDETGHALLQGLIDATERGVRVHVTVDGYGCPGFSKEFLGRFEQAGVYLRSFDPKPTLFRVRTNLLCRLHRKIVIVDRDIAFVGGINFGDVHLRSFGEESKQDYAVEVRGPAVAHIHRYCRLWSADGADRRGRWRYWLRRMPRRMLRPEGDAQVLFAIRDNDGHPTDIETLYRLGIRHAKRRVVIANAYFFPGYRFVRELGRAAARGVEVQLIMQGNPDRQVTVGAASIVYEDLLAAGVKVYRFTERPLHAKVGIIDDTWATVGSSNLDPVSLGLNLEANLFIRDEQFTSELGASLDRLISQSCELVQTDDLPAKSSWRRLLLTAAYHLTRRMSSWGRRMDYAQRLEPMRPGADLSAEPTDAKRRGAGA